MRKTIMGKIDNGANNNNDKESTVELILRDDKGKVHRVVKGEAIIFSVINERPNFDIETRHAYYGKLGNLSVALSAISGLSKTVNLLLEDIINGKST